MANSPEARLLVRRLLVSVVLMAALLFTGKILFSGLATLRTDPPRSSQERERTLVLTQVMNPRTWVESLSGYGSASAMRRTSISSELNGLVTEVSASVRPGVAVKKGQVLVELDRKDQEEARKGAEADLERVLNLEAEAKGALSTADRRVEAAKKEATAAADELKRLRELAQSSATSRSEVDAQVVVVARSTRLLVELEQARISAGHEIARAAAAVAEAKTRLARAQEAESRATIKAPWGGVVVSRGVEQGARVAAGAQLLELVDPSRVEVAIRLGASRYGEVGAGSAVRLRLSDGGPVVWEGTVTRVAPEVDESDRTFAVYCEVATEDTSAPVPPGAFVLAEVTGRSYDDVMPVPRTAFVEDSVYVAIPTESAGVAKVELRHPTIYRMLPDVALVKSGLSPGEAVILTNLDQVVEGVRVRTSIATANGGAP